jgi:hypothetical protein
MRGNKHSRQAPPITVILSVWRADLQQEIVTIACGHFFLIIVKNMLFVLGIITPFVYLRLIYFSEFDITM